MITHTTTIRVRYADTDKMGIVYNGKYLEYFEVGRTELLRSTGLPYSELEKAGYQLPLIQAHVNYKKPALYDDLIDIKAVVTELYSAKVHIDYELTHNGSGELIATGFTEHMFINASNKKPVKPPAKYIKALEPYFNKSVNTAE